MLISICFNFLTRFYRCSNLDDLHTALSRAVSEFQSSFGVLLYLYSIVLTKVSMFLLNVGLCHLGICRRSAWFMIVIHISFSEIMAPFWVKGLNVWCSWGLISFFLCCCLIYKLTPIFTLCISYWLFRYFSFALRI